MSEVNLNPGDDEETKWIEDVLLACHARGTLPSRTYLEKCVEVAERAALQREDLTKLQEALGRVHCTGSARDQILELAHAAGVPVPNAEQALFLSEGFLTERVGSRIGESSSIVSSPVTVAAKLVATPDQKAAVESSPGADASLTGPAFQRIRAWLLGLVTFADNLQDRSSIEKSAERFRLGGESS